MVLVSQHKTMTLSGICELVLQTSFIILTHPKSLFTGYNLIRKYYDSAFYTIKMGRSQKREGDMGLGPAGQQRAVAHCKGIFQFCILLSLYGFLKRICN